MYLGSVMIKQKLRCISYIIAMNKTEESKMSKSLKSKYVAKRSQIDESLFGIKNKQGQRDQQELKKVTQMVKEKNYNHRELGILKEDEVQRMKNAIRKPSKEEELQEQKLLEEEKEYKLSLARAKREQMLKFEEEKKKSQPLNDIELEKSHESRKINDRALEVTHQELDDVKLMNKMVAYAKAATIRERQKEEKERDWESHKIQQKKKDKIMEIERLKKIRDEQEAEERKKVEALKGREVIVDQIKSREIQRLKQSEEREREGQILLQKMLEQKREEEILAQKKKEAQAKINQQIIEANRNAILAGEQRKVKEKEEESKIASYIREKAQKEAEIIADQKRIKEEKEKDIQRLRELQEKASDRQAELDALRAKRAIQANQRAAREKEKIEAEIRAKRVKELQDARLEQQLEKERMLEEQARAEKAQFEAAVRKQKEIKQIQDQLQKERKQLLKKHAKDLKKQIVEKEEVGEQSKKLKEVENKKFQDGHEAQKALLERIKHEKIEELKSLNVPDKYIVELQNKTIH